MRTQAFPGCTIFQWINNHSTNHQFSNDQILNHVFYFRLSRTQTEKGIRQDHLKSPEGRWCDHTQTPSQRRLSPVRIIPEHCLSIRAKDRLPLGQSFVLLRILFNTYCVVRHRWRIKVKNRTIQRWYFLWYAWKSGEERIYLHWKCFMPREKGRVGVRWSTIPWPDGALLISSGCVLEPFAGYSFPMDFTTTCSKVFSNGQIHHLFFYFHVSRTQTDKRIRQDHLKSPEGRWCDHIQTPS